MRLARTSVSVVAGRHRIHDVEGLRGEDHERRSRPTTTVGIHDGKITRRKIVISPARPRAPPRAGRPGCP